MVRPAPSEDETELALSLMHILSHIHVISSGPYIIAWFEPDDIPWKNRRCHQKFDFVEYTLLRNNWQTLCGEVVVRRFRT